MIAAFGEVVVYSIILWIIIATLGEIYSSIVDWWNKKKK